MADGADTPEPRIVADVRIIKADPTSSTSDAVRSRGWEYEDEFSTMYGLGMSGVPRDVQILEPPYLPRTLEALCQQNNSLGVCIAAVVTNIHSTGFDIVAKDEVNKDDPRIEEISAFFDQTYPGESFRDLRVQTGRDMEQVGYCYIEVIRNLLGDIIFLRRLDPKLMRLVKLDEPRLATVGVTRAGKTFDANVMLRYRRFVQSLNGTNFLYFKEFNCPDILDAKTGRWETDANIVAVENRASEIMYFTRDEDSITPYGVPAWIAQLPSVLGSRKAEEHNLTYFDHGGVPPMMVFVNGGSLTPLAAQALREHLQGGKNKHQIPVIETVSTGGSMDSPGQVKVTVERFGSERQSDSMFESYDERSEKRVRRAWRLPPLFVGATDDYNFASAQASYIVAEAQVFAPQRQAFDEKINRTLMPILDPEGLFEFRSRPIAVKDVVQQMAALTLAVEAKTISRQQLVDTLNNIAGMDLRLEEDDLATTAPPPPDPFMDPTMDPAMQGGPPPFQDGPPIGKANVAALAVKTFKAFNAGTATRDDLKLLLGELNRLTPRENGLFKKTLADMALEGGQGGRHSAQLVTHAILTTLGRNAPAT